MSIVVNDYISDEAKRFDKWCNDLLNASPDQSAYIESLRKQLAARYQPTATTTAPNEAREEDESNSGLNQMKLMQKIMSNIPQEKTDRVVSFSGGVYELA